MEKRFSPISSLITRQGTTYKVPQGNLTINVEVIRFWKQTFEEKGKISSEEKIFDYSISYLEHDKGQGVAYKVPQGNLTINVEVIRSFLQDQRLLKT